MSEPIIREGDISALSEAVTQLSEAVAEISRQNTVLVGAVNSINERVTQLEEEKAALVESSESEN